MILVICWVLASWVPSAQVAAQDAAPATERPSLRQTTQDLITKSLREGGAWDLLGQLCQVAPRRLAGSPGAAAAVAWARDTMQQLGLENVRLQPVTVPHWVRGEVGELVVLEPPELAGERLPMLALGGSIGTPEAGLTAEVVLADGLEAAAALGERARGRIVLFNGRMDPGRIRPFEAYGEAVGQRGRGAIAAARVGAVAALVRSMTPGIDDVPHTGAMRYDDEVPPIPAAAISTRAAERLAALLSAGRKVVLHLRQDCRTLPDTEGHNVIGELRGRELPDEIVLVGGHLDAWDVGQGAQDDGGGCCQSIEALRLIQASGLRPRRTLRVVLFANEENGLAGGRAYAAAAAEAAAAGREVHVLALESDAGVSTPRGFSTDAAPEAFALLEQLVAPLDEAGAGSLEAGGGGADIGPLAGLGTILVGFMPDPQRYFDVHHTHEDTLEKVSPREINLGAGVIAALLYAVAEHDAAWPPNPRQE